MASSRRRFLMGAAAMGGVAFGRHAGTWTVPTLEPAASGRVAPAADGGIPAQTPDRRLPTQAEVDAWYTERRNWGRWGADDQLGAINLVTPEKRREATALARNGRTVSMSRVFEPTQHFMRKNPRGDTGAGSVRDYYGFIYHGQTVTHLDALCHMWDKEGMWQGGDPEVELDTHGAHFGDITAWSGGIITRGVLIDVRATAASHMSHRTGRFTGGSSRRLLVRRASTSPRATRCWSTVAERSSNGAATRSVATTDRGCMSAVPSSFGITMWRCSDGT